MFSPSEPESRPYIKHTNESEKDKGPYKPNNKQIFKGLKKKEITMARGSAQKKHPTQ